MPLGNAAFAGVEGNIDLNTADALGIEAKWGWGVSGRAGLMVNDSTGVYGRVGYQRRSEEHTSELQSLMRSSYAVFCLKKKIQQDQHTTHVSILKHTTTNIHQQTHVQ